MCAEDWILTQLFRQMMDVRPYGEVERGMYHRSYWGCLSSHLRRMWCKALLLEEAYTHMFLYWYTKALHYVLH